MLSRFVIRGRVPDDVLVVAFRTDSPPEVRTAFVNGDGSVGHSFLQFVGTVQTGQTAPDDDDVVMYRFVCRVR